MQFLDFLYSDGVLFTLILFVFLLLYLFWQTTFPHTKVRVRFQAGTEETYNAKESSKILSWVDRHKKAHEVAIQTRPSIAVRFGIKYRIFEVIDGCDVTTHIIDPSLLPEGARMESLMEGEIKETHAWRELAKGLSSLSLMDRLIMMFLGLFVGLFLYPLIFQT